MFITLILWLICVLTLYLFLFPESRGVVAGALEVVFDWLWRTKLGRTVVVLGVVAGFVLMAQWPGSGGVVILFVYLFGLWKRLRRGEASEVWAEYERVMKPVTVFMLRGFLVIGVMIGVAVALMWIF